MAARRCAAASACARPPLSSGVSVRPPRRVPVAAVVACLTRTSVVTGLFSSASGPAYPVGGRTLCVPDPILDRSAPGMAATRTERDSMGSMEVPADAYYGASTQRAVENFPISGQGIPSELVRALGLIKAAAAVVNHQKKILDDDQFRAITEAAQEVIDGKRDGDFVVDVFQTGSGTSSNMNANEVIANRAIEILGGEIGSKTPVHPNDHVNAGQSSNDVFPTAVHVAAYIACEEQLIPALERLRESLAAKAIAWADIVKPGRTHLMDAVPVTLGQEFSGYARQIELGIARVRAALARVAELPLGGTAVGTGLNAPEGMTEGVINELRRTTGIDALREADNHFEAQGARDALVELSGAC